MNAARAAAVAPTACPPIQRCIVVVRCLLPFNGGAAIPRHLRQWPPNLHQMSRRTMPEHRSRTQESRHVSEQRSVQEGGGQHLIWAELPSRAQTAWMAANKAADCSPSAAPLPRVAAFHGHMPTVAPSGVVRLGLQHRRTTPEMTLMPNLPRHVCLILGCGWTPWPPVAWRSKTHDDSEDPERSWKQAPGKTKEKAEQKELNPRTVFPESPKATVARQKGAVTATTPQWCASGGRGISTKPPQQNPDPTSVARQLTDRAANVWKIGT